MVGGFCIHLVVGNKYIWGNISDYTISRYHWLGNEGATDSNATLIFPLVLLFNNAFNPVGAYL